MASTFQISVAQGIFQEESLKLVLEEAKDTAHWLGPCLSRHGVWAHQCQHNSSNNKNLSTLYLGQYAFSSRNVKKKLFNLSYTKAKGA